MIYYTSRGENYWSCRKKAKANGGTCKTDNVKNETLRRAVVIAWNSVVQDWQEREATDPLQKLRNRQMKELVAQGPLAQEVPELTRMVLERIVVHDKTHFTVRFLDGTVREVCV